MLAAGTMIDGKYRVVRLLGEGGTGEVYEAEHAFLERRVAIKILNPEFTRSDDAVRRFYREAQAAGRVGHENICEVIDIGETAGGLPYIVMQLLQGRSLAHLIAESAPLPIGRTIDIADQALAALHAAHKAGIVHRDMKPDNIYLISVGGRHDFVKILDFGISKVRTLDGGDNVAVTRTGTVLGTPLYMSPGAGPRRFGRGRAHRRLVGGRHHPRDAPRTTALPGRQLQPDPLQRPHRADRVRAVPARRHLSRTGRRGEQGP